MKASNDQQGGGPPQGQGVVPREEEESAESVPLYRNYKLIIPAFLAILVIAVFTWRWYLGTRDYVSTDDAYVDGNRVSISSKILGRIDTLTVDEGDTVRAGQALVRLDDIDLRAQERHARATVALAGENITLARVTLDRAKMDYERAAAQMKLGAISKEQFDHALSELQASQARSGIAIAQAATARAQLGVIETQLEQTVIQSPMDGVVAKRWALPGDVVQPSQAIFSIYDLQNLWVTANLEETNLTVLRLNDPVEISIDAYPGVKFSGRVFQIGSSTASEFSLIPPNNASGNFTKVTQRVPVKISVEPRTTDPSAPVRLLPGMSVEVRVRVQ
jgi:membrane fusion protein (multidrug efflux system)